MDDERYDMHEMTFMNEKNHRSHAQISFTWPMTSMHPISSMDQTLSISSKEFAYGLLQLCDQFHLCNMFY
jgi:hypothetical protein